MSHLSHNGDLHILPCMIPIVHKLCSITYTIYMLSAENACWDKFAESTQYYHIYIIILLDIACIIESCKELPQKDLISVTQKTHNIFAASSAFKLSDLKNWKWPIESDRSKEPVLIWSVKLVMWLVILKISLVVRATNWFKIGAKSGSATSFRDGRSANIWRILSMLSAWRFNLK